MVKRYVASSEHLIQPHISPLPQNDVIVRYLLDEMGALEEDYSDALAPARTVYAESRAGEAGLIAPVTTGEFRLRTQQQEVALNEKLGAMELRLTTRIQSQLSQALNHHSHPTASRSTSG
jgi:hypothetical protein